MVSQIPQIAQNEDFPNFMINFRCRLDIAKHSILTKMLKLLNKLQHLQRSEPFKINDRGVRAALMSQFILGKRRPGLWLSEIKLQLGFR